MPPPKKTKYRADELIAKQQDIPVEEARKLILAGLVRINADHVIKNSAQMIEEGSTLILDESMQYVSRGAFKLKPSLEKHLPNLTGMIAADIGASTGGFTDLMLQSGVIKVYAVDVGYGQMHYKLRQDSRVINIERVNARSIDKKVVPEKVDVVTMDLSFISVLKVLSAVNTILKDGGWAFILVKPQFESKSSEVGKGGVVRDKEVIDRCVNTVKDFVTNELKWKVLDSMPSPILGPKGNQEFILSFRKN